MVPEFREPASALAYSNTCCYIWHMDTMHTVNEPAIKPLDAINKIKTQVTRTVLGNDSKVELLLTALLCGGHVLIEDLPGTGKTTLAKALAFSLSLSFRRIQFTPDLMPSDITGFKYYDQKTNEFVFRPGPVMANVVLADEINRAIPRTQSSLMECMGESQITVDGQTLSLPKPFFVIATQNPVDLEGTFPLPEAQLDRFLLRINLGYPSEADEHKMLTDREFADPLAEITPVVTREEVLQCMEGCQQVRMEVSVRQYLVLICRSTRTHPKILLGASPRATLGFFKASKALAFLRGRDYVLPDDIKDLVVPVLGHRLIIKPQDRISGTTETDVLNDILNKIPVPIKGEPRFDNP